MQTQFLIFLALLVIVVIIIVLKSSPQKKHIPSNVNTQNAPNSILKDNKIQNKTQKHVQFYDLRKSAISNDIQVNDATRQAPSDDLLSMYTPARAEVPTDEVPLFHKGREQLPPLRWNK